MRQRARMILSALLAAVFFCCAGLLIRQQIHDRQAAAAHEKALQVALSAKETTAPSEAAAEMISASEPEEMLPAMPVWVPAPADAEDPHIRVLQVTDLPALRRINPDIVGWIKIPDTEVNYPVLQGSDNEFYLDHAWDGAENVNGSIFLEQNNSADMDDFNTILYGHNMRNGSMFAVLHEFDDPGFWQAHPYIYLVTDAGVLRYEVFATYDAATDSDAYRLSFRQESTRRAFLDAALENSLIDTGIAPALTDRILTLSTCTGFGYSARRVVQARLKMVQILPQ